MRNLTLLSYWPMRSMNAQHSRYLVGAAENIAERLEAQAITSGREITWTIRVADLSRSAERATKVMNAGPYLYQGTAGIAIFLAELAARTRESKWSNLADQVLARCYEDVIGVSESDTIGLVSLYSGSIGVAVACARNYQISRNTQWKNAAVRLTERVLGRWRYDHVLDIIGGAAGTILGALAVFRYTGSEVGIAVAREFGKWAELQAVRSIAGWSWPPRSAPGKRNLCGYAHGTSGFAHAFLELLSVTGEASWCFAAKKALEYERTFLPATGDVPDFRNSDISIALLNPQGESHVRDSLRSGRLVPSFVPSSMKAWCHGAPGALIPRARAIQLGVDVDLCSKELAQSQQLVEDDLFSGQQRSHSLCHGSFGNAECLRFVGQCLGGGHERLVEYAEEVIRERHESGSAWISGAIGGAEDPSLLMGSAGIGLHFLALAGHNGFSPLTVGGTERPTGVPLVSDSELQHRATAELIGLTPHIAQVFQTLANEDPVRRKITTCDSIEELVNVLASVRDERAGNQVRSAKPRWPGLRSGLRPVLAQLRDDLAFEDRAEEYCRQLTWLRALEVDWASDQFVTAASVKIFRSTHLWEEWLSAGDSGAKPRKGNQFVLVFRMPNGAHRRIASPLEVLILRALKRPKTLAALQRTVRAGVDESVPESVLWAAIRTTLTRSVEGRVVVAFKNGQPPRTFGQSFS